MRIPASFLILISFASFLYAVHFDRDTVDFTDTAGLLQLANTANKEISIDSITVFFSRHAANHLGSPAVSIDTIPFRNSEFFSSRYIYYLTMDITTATGLKSPYQSSDKAITLQAHDTLKIRGLWILDGSALIPEYVFNSIKDTVKVLFHSSDNSSDSIVAIIGEEYGTAVKVSTRKSRPRIINSDGASMYLLNGKKVTADRSNFSSVRIAGKR